MRSLSRSRRRLSRWPRTSVRKRKSCFADCSQAAYVQSRWGSEELIEGLFAVICLRTGHAPILDAAPAPAPAETPQAKATQSQAPQAAPATRAATPGEETPAGLAAPAFGGILQCLDVNRSHVLESELVGGADGVAKAKAKAKAGKKKGGENPKAVFDVRKAQDFQSDRGIPLGGPGSHKGVAFLSDAREGNLVETCGKICRPHDQMSSLIDSEHASARQGKWPRLPCSCKGTRLLRRPWRI